MILQLLRFWPPPSQREREKKEREIGEIKMSGTERSEFPLKFLRFRLTYFDIAVNLFDQSPDLTQSRSHLGING